MPALRRRAVGGGADAQAHPRVDLFWRGDNPKQVRAWLGHHSAAFTLATYVHLLPDDLPEPVSFDAITRGEGVSRVSARPAENGRDAEAVAQ